MLVCVAHLLYALLSHYFKSSTCVCSVIFSLQRRCMGVLCCYFRPKMFSPGDHVRYHSRTFGAHVLATVVGPAPWATVLPHSILYRSFGSSITFVLDETYWHRINAKVASHVFACLHQWRVPQFALQYPCNPPPPPGRPSLGDRLPPPPGSANPGVCKGGEGMSSVCIKSQQSGTVS